MTDFPECLTIDTHRIEIVPRYVETDKAGVVHHSVYPIWFEMGRTELLRVNGLAYSALEAAGFFFVIAEMELKYRRPALYDEKLELETVCSKVTAGKVEHKYRLTRPGDSTLLTEGRTVLACISSEGKVRRVPKFMYPQ